MNELQEKRRVSPDRQVLVLDERGARNLSDPDSKFYFVGGISLAEQSVTSLAESVRQFKADLFPDHDPASWELKGSKMSIGNDDIDAARRKWSAWAKHLAVLGTAYTFHGCFVSLEPFCAGRCNGDRSRVETEAIEVGLKTLVHRYISTALYREREVPYHKPLIRDIEFVPSRFVHDTIANTQRKIAVRTIEKIIRPFSPDWLSPQLEIVDASDNDSDLANIVQFVDMQIFAFTRFCAPKAPKRKLFLDFEQYPADFIDGSVQDYEDLPDKGRSIVDRFYQMTPIFHHIRLKIRKNWFDEQGNALSTIALVDREIHEDFGARADHAIWSFCNGNFEFYRSDFFREING